jgi:plasmid stabilization system protein ParE
MAHRLTAQAEADLEQIWNYIVKENGNIEIARRQIVSITDRFYLLANHPHLGRARAIDLGLVDGAIRLIGMSSSIAWRMSLCLFFVLSTVAVIQKPCSAVHDESRVHVTLGSVKALA